MLGRGFGDLDFIRHLLPGIQGDRWLCRSPQTQLEVLRHYRRELVAAPSLGSGIPLLGPRTILPRLELARSYC